MTQVKEWSNPELNRALTELQGYSVKPASTNPKWYRMVNPQGQEFGVALPTEGLVWNEYAFPYCTDAAASLEVQAAAVGLDFEGYVINLARVQGTYLMSMDRDSTGCITRYAETDVVAELLTATPRERAEAAYITLSSKQ